MTTSHVSDEQLQRHYDGELEPAEQLEARNHLADCTSCTARLESLARLSGLIRLAHEDAIGTADFRDLFSRIERAIDAPGDTVVAPNAKARAKWFRPATMSALGGLAVAAAVLLMIYQQDSSTTETLPDDSGTTLAVLDTPRSEIVHVDFGTNAGTVFEIAMADGTSTPVVWINDEDLGE
jgi:anti-sigma factor RsiW